MRSRSLCWMSYDEECVHLNSFRPVNNSSRSVRTDENAAVRLHNTLDVLQNPHAIFVAPVVAKASESIFPQTVSNSTYRIMLIWKRSIVNAINQRNTEDLHSRHHILEWEAPS